MVAPLLQQGLAKLLIRALSLQALALSPSWAAPASASGSVPGPFTAGPRVLWANVGQLQEVVVRGTFKPGANLSCRVVDAPCE